ncbi:MAG: QacE family quaternary ammonium compound efflux SMR transporter [Alphaproteobacteria bacterium CG11_big_fil_rev_8_21_14_0_20_44_7]|nr:MAG: QacE family quaternary ammonium compound efflux SMR transporter [Alphaproteobacteria bacterium CG11_big_fil_rev_8_21_14_0_20_44_7]
MLLIYIALTIMTETNIDNENMTGWFILYSIIALTVIANAFLKISGGLEQKYYLFAGLVILTIVNFGYSYVLKTIPIAIAYTLWSGLGITLLTIMGWLIFKEHLTTAQLLWMGVIIIGCVGLNLSTAK